MRRSLATRILYSWVADVIATVVGFLGTIYLARTLGAASLGVFAVGTSVLMWLRVADLGVTQATIKRISEQEREGEVIVTTFLLQGTLAVVAVGLIVLLRERVNEYIGGEFTLVIAGLFLLNYLANGTVTQILSGKQAVHVSNAIKTLERTLRVLFQVGLVVLGYSVLGLFLGYAGSLVVATVIGFAYLLRMHDISVAIPDRKTFFSIIHYAKYSALSVVKSQAFSSTDIILMGFFLGNSVIGVYQVSWTLAMTFLIFGNAMQKNLFPEISSEIADGASDRTRAIFSESLTYAGIFPIAGVVGAALLGQQILAIYGSEFTTGGTVLTVLVFVALLRSYEQQIHALLDGIDRPDLTFRLNVVFTIMNVVLNLLLVPRYGAIGAGVATVIATGLNVVLGWRMSTVLVDVRLPVAEVGKQILAALIMGTVVYGATTIVTEEALSVTLALVTIGAGIYFTTIIALSTEIRSKAITLVNGIAG